MQFLPIWIVLKLPLIVQAIYLALCGFVGVLGRNRKMGFWGTLFGSIILSPFVGILIVLVSKKK